MKEKIFYFQVVLLFIMPSLIYLINGKSLVFFEKENQFLLNDSSSIIQFFVYIISVILLILAYIIILKRNKKIFKDIKNLYYFIGIISIAFIVVIPFLSSDLFYYLGIGRLNSTYNQNPYYITITDYVTQNRIDFTQEKEDTMLIAGFLNSWSDTTVVYGPIWTIICSVFAKLSLGNVNLGILVFKIASIIVHLLNCCMIYKISKKRIFVLIYGLNPFILVEGIGNVHNDIYMVLFTLVSIYMLVKKNKILLSLLFLSFATNIKFVMILLLPLFIIFYLKNEKIKYRILGCIKYGLIFSFMFFIPYIFYMQDFSIFTCFLVQRDRYARSLYDYIYTLTQKNVITNFIKNLFLLVFIILYFIKCLKLLLKNNISFRLEMRNFLVIIFIFIFLLLTNFQAWYLCWLSIFIIWQKKNMIKFITIIQLTMLFSYGMFILIKWYNIADIAFFFTNIIGVLIAFWGYSFEVKRKLDCFKSNR